ncbi:MAG: hypothetical protein ACKO1F_12040 [Flammeovirgaceae bacterium]
MAASLVCYPYFTAHSGRSCLLVAASAKAGYFYSSWRGAQHGVTIPLAEKLQKGENSTKKKFLHK